MGINQMNAEALALAQGFGLDLATTLKVIGGTTASNGQLSINWPNKVLKGDLEPGFRISLAHKDVSLAVEAARRMGIPVYAGAIVARVWPWPWLAKTMATRIFPASPIR